MKQTRLRPDQVEIWNLHLQGLSGSEIGKRLGIAKSNANRRLEVIRRFLEQEGADPGRFAPGATTQVDADGTIERQWIRTPFDKQSMLDSADEIVAALNAEIVRKKKTKTPKVSKADIGFMNSYVFGDPHLNMYSWARETGADWDVRIAVERHTQGMLDLISNARQAHTGRFISLGDLLHNDSLKPLTLNQTAVDVDGRLSMAVDETVSLLRMCIDLMLTKYRHVDVILARGNHPPTIELLLSKMLRVAYEKEPRISVVDNTPKHIPMVFGDNFQLITHGDRLNHQRKADIATSIFRDLHGSAKFTHVLSGHLHHHDSKEISGVMSEIFQVLPTKDAWHTEQGFVSADQSATVIRYHPKGGIVDRHFYNPRFQL